VFRADIWAKESRADPNGWQDGPPPMPKRLRPTAPIAADAVLVGDPGRALLLAQELLEEPKMCNHARGLWGYSGMTTAARELTIQTTGMGGPSAAIVLADLAELGMRRAVRVGTCVAIDPTLKIGELLLATEALAPGGAALPDPDLNARLEQALGSEVKAIAIASLDRPAAESTAVPSGVSAADLQTATVLSRCRTLGIAAAAILIVEEGASSEPLGDRALEQAAKRAGAAALSALSG
jgi:uridine phosphorylase